MGVLLYPSSIIPDLSVPWAAAQGRLAMLSADPPRDGTLPAAVSELARELMAVGDAGGGNLALAAIMLLDHPEYPLAHCLHTALVADLVARPAHWDEPERHSLVSAALTMNLSMLTLQMQLCEQAGEPTPAQRALIHAHPAASSTALREYGVEDPDWLCAVLEHHETPDGRGYPNQLHEPCEMAMLLHTADVFTAKVSPRAHRQALIACEATQAVLTRLAHRGKNPFPPLLLREIGLYPAGSVLRLASGETGVVVRRGPEAAMPIVAVLFDAAGAPVAEPPLRCCGENAASAIAVALARDALPGNVDFSTLRRLIQPESLAAGLSNED